MNKYLILLGLVLIASLSFAGKGGPENWMQISEGNYDCMYKYNLDLLNLIGPSCYIITEGQYFSIYDTYFDSKGGMFGAMEEMYYYSGCDGPVSPSDFKSGMLLFNTNNVAFKQIYLANIKECVADPGCYCSKGEVLGYLNEFKSSYQGCVSDRAYCVEPMTGTP